MQIRAKAFRYPPAACTRRRSSVACARPRSSPSLNPDLLLRGTWTFAPLSPRTFLPPCRCRCLRSEVRAVTRLPQHNLFHIVWTFFHPSTRPRLTHSLTVVASLLHLHTYTAPSQQTPDNAPYHRQPSLRTGIDVYLAHLSATTRLASNRHHSIALYQVQLPPMIACACT